MIKVISGFEWRYIVDKPMTATSTKRIQIKRSCDNCYCVLQLCNMSDGCQVCEECSKDIETLTNRIPRNPERN